MIDRLAESVADFAELDGIAEALKNPGRLALGIVSGCGKEL